MQSLKGLYYCLELSNSLRKSYFAARSTQRMSKLLGWKLHQRPRGLRRTRMKFSVRRNAPILVLAWKPGT